MEIANRYANGEEEDRIMRGKGRAEPSQWKNNNGQSGQNRNNNNRNKRKPDSNDGVNGAELVVVANQNKGKGQKKKWVPRKKANIEDDILDKPCQIHIIKDADGSFILPKHTTRQTKLHIPRGKTRKNLKTNQIMDFPKKKACS